MSIKTAIYEKLHGTTAVASLVGTRIFPYSAKPKTQRPFIVYQLTGRERPHTMTRPVHPITDTLDLHCVADTGQEAESLGLEVVKALNLEGGNWGELPVQRCFVTNESEERDDALNPDAPLYVYTVEVQVKY